MEKVSLLTRVIFHISNILLIALYLYPGSIMGWLLYGNIQKQPQITSDYVLFSSNHIYAFLILSILGLFSYYSKNIKILFLYLFLISIFLELLHYVIPQRSFELKDLLGNFFGVLIVLGNIFDVDVESDDATWNFDITGASNNINTLQKDGAYHNITFELNGDSADVDINQLSGTCPTGISTCKGEITLDITSDNSTIQINQKDTTNDS